jgi:hypothetical protein
MPPFGERQAERGRRATGACRAAASHRPGIGRSGVERTIECGWCRLVGNGSQRRQGKQRQGK